MRRVLGTLDCVYLKFKTSGRTCKVSGYGVYCQLPELGLVIGRKVPVAKVVCQSVVMPRKVDSDHVKIMDSREKSDLKQAK